MTDNKPVACQNCNEMISRLLAKTLLCGHTFCIKCMIEDYRPKIREIDPESGADDEARMDYAADHL
jgi:hypothetical protein